MRDYEALRSLDCPKSQLFPSKARQRIARTFAYYEAREELDFAEEEFFSADLQLTKKTAS